MADGLEFVVLARLVLLGAQSRDALLARANIELEVLAINLNFPAALFQCFNRGYAGRELRLEVFALQRQSFYFVVDLPDFLLSILQNEQLFQLWMHGPPSYWVNVTASIVGLEPSKFLAVGFSVELVEGFEDLFWPNTNTDAFGEIHPTNRAGGINEKFGRPRDVGFFRPGARMEQIVTANHFRAGVGKERESETELFGMPIIYLGGVDANGDNAKTARVEVGELLLETPQLGVTEWSPESAVKNHDRALSGNEIG